MRNHEIREIEEETRWIKGVVVGGGGRCTSGEKRNDPQEKRATRLSATSPTIISQLRMRGNRGPRNTTEINRDVIDRLQPPPPPPPPFLRAGDEINALSIGRREKSRIAHIVISVIPISLYHDEPSIFHCSCIYVSSYEFPSFPPPPSPPSFGFVSWCVMCNRSGN